MALLRRRLQWSDVCMYNDIVEEATTVEVTVTTACVELSWIPLGAGNSVVRANGKVFEAISSAVHRGRKADIYHSVLQVAAGNDRYTIEMAPTPDSHGEQRGVVGTGSVGLRWLGRFRIFRYENRCWRNGVIPDLATSVSSTRMPTSSETAQRLVDLTASVPTPVWGRDELRTGEMWNSNSVISWLLIRSGIGVDGIVPPPNGRAPGWKAGVTIADREGPCDESSSNHGR